ncbi:BON1-associated protein 2-like [Vicia villosa]|uniref:BON1-associated protein 2-like n=1 Tax=Vicia villosa TaxID=3911 RepID=UPI00273AA5BC|nr:BON1-associated protein 2-like [Vicia villosa]
MGVNATSRTLEITVISGENIHGSEDAYVVVRGESLNCHTTKTVKANNGVGENSSFLSGNETFMLDMPLHARSVTFEVQSKKFKGVHPIGVARIAVADFLDGDESENCMRVLSYRLRDWEGRKNGVIHFGVRVVVPEKISVTVAEKDAVVSGKKCGDSLAGVDFGGKNSNGVVVIGIPILANYPNTVI